MWVWKELAKNVGFSTLSYGKIQMNLWANTIELWFGRQWGFIALELTNQLDVNMEEERRAFFFFFSNFPKPNSSIWLKESDLLPGYVLIPGYVLDS